MRKNCRICTSWAETSTSYQVVAELKKRSEEIAQSLTMESGKPIKDARGEVSRTIDTFQVAAEESVRIYGEHMPLDISARNKGLQVLTTASFRLNSKYFAPVYHCIWYSLRTACFI